MLLDSNPFPRVWAFNCHLLLFSLAAQGLFWVERRCEQMGQGWPLCKRRGWYCPVIEGSVKGSEILFLCQCLPCYIVLQNDVWRRNKLLGGFCAAPNTFSSCTSSAWVQSISTIKLKSTGALRKQRDIFNQTTPERADLNFSEAEAPGVQTPWSAEERVNTGCCRGAQNIPGHGQSLHCRHIPLEGEFFLMRNERCRRLSRRK